MSTEQNETSIDPTIPANDDHGAGFDLSVAIAEVEAEDAGTVIHIKNARGAPMFHGGAPVTMRVAGSYSAAYRKAESAQRDEAIKRRSSDMTGDQLFQNSLAILAGCVLEWSGFIANGKPFPCTKANVIKVLDAAPWVRRQVDEAVHDHAGFFGASSTR